MLYRRFGRTNIQLSALGMGTIRFKAGNDADIENSSELVKEAIEQGVNYIDVCHAYQMGRAEKVIRRALEKTSKEIHVTVKVSYQTDKTAEAAYQRIVDSLENMGLKKVTFFLFWTVYSYDEFLKILEPGATYDGALRAKEEGLIDYICISTHASPDEIIKIMETGKVDGVTITYSVLNQAVMQPVINRAEELDIGIITMNPLCGGIIPENKDFFSFLRQKNDKGIAGAALSYIYAHPQITTMISGMRSIEELKENIEAVTVNENPKDAEKRISIVNQNISGISGFCTGCGYCKGCPVGVDTSALMYSYNEKFFSGDLPYKRTGKELCENIRICYKLFFTFQFLPETSNNPCLKCGECEKKCTQHIPIIDRLDELYKRFEKSGYSKKYIFDRIIEIFNTSYKKIALYPDGRYTSNVIDFVNEILPNDNFEISIFDRNSFLWGKFNNGFEIFDPSLIPEIKPDVLVITNYIHQNDIYDSLKYLENKGIKVIKLHNQNDVPWIF